MTHARPRLACWLLSNPARRAQPATTFARSDQARSVLSSLVARNPRPRCPAGVIVYLVGDSIRGGSARSHLKFAGSHLPPIQNGQHRACARMAELGREIESHIGRQKSHAFQALAIPPSDRLASVRGRTRLRPRQLRVRGARPGLQPTPPRPARRRSESGWRKSHALPRHRARSAPPRCSQRDPSPWSAGIEQSGGR